MWVVNHVLNFHMIHRSRIVSAYQHALVYTSAVLLICGTFIFETFRQINLPNLMTTPSSKDLRMVLSVPFLSSCFPLFVQYHSIPFHSILLHLVQSHLVPFTLDVEREVSVGVEVCFGVGC